MPKFQDLTNRRYERLLVIEYVGRNKSKKSMWRCICDCGKEVIAPTKGLNCGDYKSCGCYHKEKTSELLTKRNTKHGESATRIYKIWTNVKSRCFRKSAPEYKYYGGRGITMCDEWKVNFEAFKEWTINNGYSDKLTLDRINNDGNYEPDNCRWTTMLEQANNKRNSLRRINYQGKDVTVNELSRLTGIRIGTLYQRIQRNLSDDEVSDKRVKLYNSYYKEV